MYKTGLLTFIAATGGVESHRLVKLSSGEVAHNTDTSTDDPIGVTAYAADAGENVAVSPLNQTGTIEMTAAGSVSAGDDVYASDDGKVQGLPTSAGDYRKIGIAMQAASGDGSIIEVLPYDFNHVETVTE